MTHDTHTSDLSSDDPSSDARTDAQSDAHTGDLPDAQADSRPDAHPDHADGLSRRRVLAAGAALGATALAGCSDEEPTPEETPTPGETSTPEEDSDSTAPMPDLPQVEDPPEAAYVPTHFEGMRHLDPVEAGEYEIVPMITYPHVFWNVFGDEREEAAPTGGEDVHLMVTVRDPETGTILPAETGLELTVGPEGESGSTHAPWPMISQEMGFHVGDNVPLGEDGSYEVEVRVGPIDARKTGAFEGRFEEPGTGSFTFAFDDEFRAEVVEGIQYVENEDHWGRHGALANHVAGGHGHHHGDGDGHHGDGGEDDHHDEDGSHHGGDEEGDEHHGDEGDEHHGDGHHHDHRGRERWEESIGGHRYGTYKRDGDETELPPAEDLPGTLQGTPVTGDAVFATTLLAPDSRLGDGDAHYLAVSPRTPYNRSMLPMMALDYAVERDGEVVAEGELRDVLDPELGYHYATDLPDVQSGDELTVTVETVPQASRHAGYETAFFEMDSVEVTLEP